jgi:hypothetical protein
MSGASMSRFMSCKLVDEDRSLLGDDWWPYGVEAQGLIWSSLLRCRCSTIWAGLKPRLGKLQ